MDNNSAKIENLRAYTEGGAVIPFLQKKYLLTCNLLRRLFVISANNSSELHFEKKIF